MSEFTMSQFASKADLLAAKRRGSFERKIEELSKPETDEEMRARFEANFTDRALLERFSDHGGYKLAETRLKWSWFCEGATR